MWSVIKYRDRHQNEVIFVTSVANFSTLFPQKKRLSESSKFRSNHNVSPYNQHFTFTGKERDTETGYSYFRARYYDCDLPGLFLSVDPMADKYPSLSPYAYCAWNPVKLVDPNGDTCKYANDETRKYVNQLLDPSNESYSPDFVEKYSALDKDEHNYVFQIWEGDPTKGFDGLFKPKSLDGNTSQILFTKGETPDSKNPYIGMSEFKLLFEETFHAWKYKENNHTQYSTCLSEAQAWIFSARAPGTKHFYGKDLKPTLMGHIFCSLPELLALEFKYGFSDKYGGKEIPALYPHLEIYPNNKFRRSIGLPEWH